LPPEFLINSINIFLFIVGLWLEYIAPTALFDVNRSM